MLHIELSLKEDRYATSSISFSLAMILAAFGHLESDSPSPYKSIKFIFSSLLMEILLRTTMSSSLTCTCDDNGYGLPTRFSFAPSSSTLACQS